ncbi:MAG TPA: SprT-like domain-containing protein [Gemmatimonadales bacterium]|nr:SprT-like domain-containing protein [Gemmatimonadales bacterium]
MTKARTTRAAELRFHPVYRPRDDAALLARVRGIVSRLNARHFEGRLVPPPLRLSGRMRTRLACITLGPKTGAPVALTVSRRHLLAADWREVEQTLLHEMVHLWQHAEGLPVDHGPSFRRKAKAVGAVPFARRRLPGGNSQNRGDD